MLEIEITTRCNLNCAHCYNRDMKVVDMPLERIKILLKFAEEKSVSSFVLSGGEASLHPEFDSLAKHLLESKPKIRTVVQSNGAIEQKDINLLRGFKVVHLSFEPDDSNVRRSSGQKTLKLASKFKEAGMYVYLFVTLHKKNIDKIDWMVQVANSLSIDIGFNLCVARHIDSDLVLPIVETKRVTEKLYKLFLERKILRFTSPLVAILQDKSSTSYIGNRGGCTAGIAACVILPNGDVTPCPFLRVKAGSIYEKDLTEIWFDSPVFNELRNRAKFDEPCGSCEYLSYCGGCRKNALAHTGKLTGFDPRCFLKYK